RTKIATMLIHVDLLDPRPEAVAAACPLAASVNIPADQLPMRRYELPRRGEAVKIAALEGADAAMEPLRDADLVPMIEHDLVFGGPAQRARLWEPSSFLEETLPHLTTGTALDLGCGAGRDSVFLAAHGWTVQAVDRLPDALEIGRGLAARYLERGEIDNLVWLNLDLDARPVADIHPQPDLAIMFRFLHHPTLAALPSLLAPGGSVLLEVFTLENAARHGKPRPSRCAGVRELTQLIAPLKVLQADENWRRDGRHTARIWARR
ncbi:MAG TPA: class I SAM-dependent methyltransferase, partial [Fimbriimonadaceae bacterium]|nr:class I SAM-dependent methyltransferase [Fimbriimonadaceae bacterium]